MTCKHCIIVRSRILARGMVALGFDMDSILAKIKEPLANIGYHCELHQGVISANVVSTVVEAGLDKSYVMCRSNGK